MSAVAEDASTSGWMLIGLSFIYGVFHAVGPGHGKAVIATYLGTHRESVARGIGISMFTALLQSVVAIVLVSTAAKVLSLKFSDIDNYGESMAAVSYVLVMLLGLVLAASAIRRFFHLKRSTESERQVDHFCQDHIHRPDDVHTTSGCGCQHAHVPAVDHSWLRILAVVFSIGMRPCSGAIVVLIYAHLVGVYHYGIAATLFMGLGTGLSVSVVALGSLYVRDWLEDAMSSSRAKNQSQGAVNYAVISISIRLAGGAMLILMGWGLYYNVLRTGIEHPLL